MAYTNRKIDYSPEAFDDVKFRMIKKTKNQNSTIIKKKAKSFSRKGDYKEPFPIEMRQEPWKHGLNSHTGMKPVQIVERYKGKPDELDEDSANIDD